MEKGISEILKVQVADGSSGRRISGYPEIDVKDWRREFEEE